MRQSAASQGRSPTVVVLHEAFAADARPDELDALLQVEETADALERLGWQVSTLAVGLDANVWLKELESRRPDCVFNLVESLCGSGRLITFVPTLLAAADIPFTGSDADAIHLSSNKLLAKHWLTVHGIATPAWIGSASAVNPKRGPWIVKSVWEHASLGLDDDSIVHGQEALAERIDHCKQQYGGEWFAERFIDGREFNVSVIDDDGEPRVLPIAEISFDEYTADKPRIVGYDAKWNSDTFEYLNTPRIFPRLDAATSKRLKSLAKKCWRLFRLRGYARVDIRMDQRGMPWVLEINANPCLSSDAGFAAAASQAGLDFDRVIEAIIGVTMRQVPNRSDSVV